MANCLPWYNTYKLSVLNVRLFYCKKNEVVFCLPYSHVHTRVTVKFKGSKFPCTGSGSQVRDFEYGFWGKKGKNHQYFYFKKKCYSLIFICKTNAGHFAMSHGSYDLNLSSEILILAGDIMARSWLNLGGTYGIYRISSYKTHGYYFFIRPSTAGIIRMWALLEGVDYFMKLSILKLKPAVFH